MKTKEKATILKGASIEHLDRLQAEYLKENGFKITVNNLLLKLLSKATLEDIR
jgi:hypothetical protein